jgi:hypothetical protein
VLRTIAAGCVALAVPVALGAGTASADAPDKYAWWWKPKQNATLTFVPAPPNVDTSDFFVANDLTGPLAIGAVHFQVLGSGDATLTLKAKDSSTFTAADIGACPATSVWDGVFAGSWDQKPTWDAGGCVKGTAAADGLSMTWTVGSAFQPADGVEGEYSVILVPQGTVPFSVVVRQPDDSTFTGYAPGAPGGGFTDPGVPDGSAAGDGFAPVGDSFGSSDIGAVGGAGPALDLPAAPVGGASGAPAGGSGGAAAGAGGSAVLPVQAAGTSSDDDTGARVASAVLLGLIAAALWWLGGVRQAVPAPAALDAPTRVGGIGRFARPRSTPPNRL